MHNLNVSIHDGICLCLSMSVSTVLCLYQHFFVNNIVVDNCLNSGSMQICLHVLAAAEVNGELSLYIKLFKKVRGKQPGNISLV